MPGLKHDSNNAEKIVQKERALPSPPTRNPTTTTLKPSIWSTILLIAMIALQLWFLFSCVLGVTTSTNTSYPTLPIVDLGYELHQATFNVSPSELPQDGFR
jgi:hypothetical protein